MADKKNLREINLIVTLVQWDVDHGKTTLTAAITKVLAEKVAQNLLRMIKLIKHQRKRKEELQFQQRTLV